MRSSGLEAVLADDDVVDLLRDLELSLARLGHADRIDRQRDERRAVLLRERHDGVDALAAVLHVDGVDDRAAGNRLERALDHRRLGGVDHDRRLDGHRQQLDDLRHLLGFVAALGDGDADVEHVRARFHLLARDVGDALVVVGKQQPLHLARALRVDALADEQRLGILVEVGGAHRRRRPRNLRSAHRAGDGRFADAIAPLRRLPRRRRASRSPRDAPASCRSTRRRCARRTARRTRRASAPSAPARADRPRRRCRC